MSDTPEDPEAAAFKALLAAIPAFTPDKLVKLYVKTRDAKSKAAKQAEAQEERFKAIMTTCEGIMLKHAKEQGVTGFTTPYGTTYTATTMKVSIADDAAFFGFVKQSGDLDFFERRVSSRHVEDYAKANDGATPPGLNIFRENVMRVRKAGEKT